MAPLLPSVPCLDIFKITIFVALAGYTGSTETWSPTKSYPSCPSPRRPVPASLSRPSWGYRETASPMHQSLQDIQRINYNNASKLWTGEQ